MVDETIRRQLYEATRRVAIYRRAWQAASPERKNQAYELYRAEQAYLAKLIDGLYSGAIRGVRRSYYHANESASERTLGASNKGWGCEG